MDNESNAASERPLDKFRLATQVDLWSYESYADDEASEGHQILLNRLNNREAVIGIVGLDFVGLPLAVAFAEAGFNVIGIDLDPAKIAALLSTSALLPLVESGHLRAESSAAALRQADVVCICVPTPLLKSEASDLALMIQAIDMVVSIAHDEMLIVFESTTAPGTAVQLLVPKLRSRGLEVGKDILVACAPSRTDPANPQFGLRNIPKVVGGITPIGTELATALYQTVVNQVIPVSDATTAETVKLLESAFHAVSAALINELAQTCDWLGVQVWEVIKAASSKPFDFMPADSGRAPSDPPATAPSNSGRLIDLASEINLAMPKYVVEKVIIALNDEAKAVRNARILVLGTASKRDSGDTYDSPALEVIERLLLLGAQISYHDPYVPQLDLPNDQALQSRDLNEDVLQSLDCLVIVTDHRAFDWQRIADQTALVVDCRNALGKVKGRARVVSL